MEAVRLASRQGRMGELAGYGTSQAVRQVSRLAVKTDRQGKQATPERQGSPTRFAEKAGR
jgi:hypothetical protein